MLYDLINIPVPCSITLELTYLYLRYLEYNNFFEVFVCPCTATNLHQIAFEVHSDPAYAYAHKHNIIKKQ